MDQAYRLCDSMKENNDFINSSLRKYIEYEDDQEELEEEHRSSAIDEMTILKACSNTWPFLD